MKNEIKWVVTEDSGVPMTLVEKGLNFTGATAFLFYVSGLVSMASMGWVIVLSFKMLQYSRTAVDLPKYYAPIAMLCIVISVFFIKSFYNLFNNRRKYLK